MSKTNTKGATPHSVNTLSVAGMQEENHGVPLHCPQSEHYLPLYSRTQEGAKQKQILVTNTTSQEWPLDADGHLTFGG